MLSYPFYRESCLAPLPHLDLLGREQMARVAMPSGHPAYLAARHRDVAQALSDRRLSRRAMLATPGGPRMTLADLDEPSLLGLDPPEHTRVRQLCNPAFRRPAIQALQAAIRDKADRLIDALHAAPGPADLHRDFSLPLSVGVICDLLGITDAQRAKLLQWTRHKLALTSLPPGEARAGHEALRAHVGELLFGGAPPNAGLLAALFEAYREGRIGRRELLATVINLFVAGHVTTAAAITNGALYLLARADQWSALRGNPGLLDSAVHELLRFDAIADSGLPRLATADLRIGATAVRAGEVVIPSHAHADRDPEAFARPNDFDIARPPGPSMAFGHGPHYCIGAHLALLELRVALGTIIERLPRLRLAAPAHALPMNNGALIGGVTTLPIEIALRVS